MTCQRSVRKEEPLQSRNDEIENSRRHITISTTRGVVTEMEHIQPDQYTLRYLKSSTEAGMILETGWIGFRYRDAHWSFVKQ